MFSAVYYISVVSRIFQEAARKAPCILFLDELDGIASSRDLGQSGSGSGSSSSVALRVLSTLLNEMDGIENSVGVVVVAATNRVHAIDPALMRPGRFDAIVRVPLPSPADRAEILKVHTRALALAADVDLSHETGFGSDVWTGTFQVSSLASTVIIILCVVMSQLHGTHVAVSVLGLIITLPLSPPNGTGSRAHTPTKTLSNIIQLDNWSGADLAQLCRKAAMLALREAVMSSRDTTTTTPELQVEASHF